MSRLRKARYKHDCDLPEELIEDNVVAISPYASSPTKCWYRLRCYITIHKNYESSQYFRSHAAFQNERRRHLESAKYRNVIHPLSLMVLQTRVLMCFVWLIAYILYPYLGSFEAKYYLSFSNPIPLYMYCIVIFNDILLAMDMFCRFAQGYVVGQTGEVVLEPQTIVKNYIKTYFFFDFVPLVCHYIIWIFWFTTPFRLLILYQTHVLRWARLKTLLDNCNHLLCCFDFKEPHRICVQICILILLILHWWTCLMALIPIFREQYNLSNNDSWLWKLQEERLKFALSRQITGDVDIQYATLHNYCQYMANVMSHFFGVGVVSFQTNDAVEMLIFSLIIISGLSFYVYTIAKVLQLFGMVNISETKYEELVTQASEYMVTKKFSSVLRKRIHKYYDYKFGKTFFSENQILDSLSEHLRMEILLYSCRNLIDKVQIFRGLSKAAVGCILALLKQEIYLTKDVIMSAEDTDGTLYFILYGTCGIRLSSGREAAHIEDGDHFGNVGQLDQTLDFLYSVEALEVCEIYTLSSNDIRYCCVYYPEIRDKLQQMVKIKSRYYNTVFSLTALEDEFMPDDIMAELRRGNILEHGRRRIEPFNIKFSLT